MDLLRALVWVDLLRVRALVWAARPEVDSRRRAWEEEVRLKCFHTLD